MKKTTTLLLLCFILAISPGLLFAQKGFKKFTGSSATSFYKGASTVLVNEKRSTISFIQLQDNQAIAESKSKEWLKNDVLKVRGEDNLVQYQNFSDKSGYNHTRYRQQYKGVPVEYGVYYVHAKMGSVQSANGEWYNGINLSTKPSLTPLQAYSAACNYMNATAWWHEREEADNNRLMILPVDGSYKLVYKCDVYAKEPWKREWVYVDAQKGNIVKTESRIHETDVPGSAITAYSGKKAIVSDSFATNTFRLREYTRGAGVETFNVSEPNDFTGSSKDWDYTGSFDIYALDAHYGAEATYDYYNNNYGWKSVDGNGTQKLKSLVHTGPGINAFWDGTYMSYLDGDASMGVTPLTSLDVCGHELTHGVTEHSSGLIYSCESGGINESMSDIFGITIRFLNITNGTWELGDQFNYVIRDMSNPNAFSNPDCYDGLFWSNCPEVHSGSGVGNFWYYLLTDGGSGTNDVGNGYFVEGLGLVDAGAIAFRTNTVYLTPNSDYAELGIYSVISAQDLYGDCSNQAMQTANANFAVNIGGPFADAVTAIFSAPQTTFCTTTAAVTFVNSSLNGTDYLWDFGDGTTSTDLSPTHSYASEGTYTVSLIVNGSALCNTSDTMVKPDYIVIANVGQPVAATCIPVTAIPSTGFGVFGVTFNDINNSSAGSAEGYQDRTCSDFTYLVAGDPYVLTVNTGAGKSEDLRVWIDYDGDGAFNNTNELIFQSNGVQNVHTGIVYTSATATLNTPLRMRVMDDKSTFDITDACYNPQQGQAEDYSVIFLPVTSAPVADFVADQTTINFGDVVNFFDLSSNGPTQWEWTFDGGNPSTSTLQNPTGIQYPTVGTYDVTLKVTNTFGTNTITKPAYITVSAEFNMCEVDTVNLESGTFYDSGGPAANYSSNENCSLLISPGCASSVTLNFSAFSSSSANDVLKVYDGSDATAPLILTVSGFPFPTPSVTSSTGQMFMTWTTDANGVNAGYTANFTTVSGGIVTPVADFDIDNANPPLNVPVNFTDQTTNIPIHWDWTFGDGGTSTAKNPSYAYTTPGNYTVTLIASNCGGADTVSQTVSVQEAAIMVIEPNSITVTLGCGVDSVTVPVTIFNNGSGDLEYNAVESEYNFQGDKPNVLALTYGADMTDCYPNTISMIDQNYGSANYTLATVNTTDGAILADALQGKNVFLMTKPTGAPAIYSNFAAPLQDFVNNGGTVVFCGASETQLPCIVNTGLLAGSYAFTANNFALDVLPSPLTLDVGTTIGKAPKNTFSHNFTSDITTVVDYNGTTVVGYSEQGLGHVVYVGFDFKNMADTSGMIIGNVFSWINSNLVGDWVSIDPAGGGTIESGDQEVIDVTIVNDGLENGTYTEYIVVTGNDVNNPVDTIVCTVIVDTENCFSFETIAGCEGQICFNDSVIGTSTSVSWDFGDGATSTQNDPCHSYSAPGTYDVQLIGCSSTSGCDTVTQSVTVSILSASIQYSPTVAYENDEISFTSNAAGATSYDWDFGDGTTSTLQDPTHTYTTQGVYTVTLTVTDATGCSFETTQTITILEVGIESVNADISISVFPNPSNQQATISYTLGQSADVTIELWNNLGQRVLSILPGSQQKAGTYSYPVIIPEAGMYMIRFAAGDDVIWRKLVSVQ